MPTKSTHNDRSDRRSAIEDLPAIPPPTRSGSSGGRRQWWIAGIAAVGLAVFLGFLEAGQVYLRQLVVADPISWWFAVGRTLPTWIALALLIPLIVRVASRARLDRPPRGRTLVIQLAAAALFVVVHSAIVAAYYTLLSDVTGAFWTIFGKVVTFLAVSDMIIYAAIAGGLHAWHSYKELRAREVATAQLQASLNEARLQALRGQLNPHFLFNALNAISVLALKEESAQVVLTLSRLSDLLRVSLAAEPRQQVRLAEELAFVDGYLEIQQLRFADRLSVAREIDPRALDGLVPAMILQPLVENAVLHGVAPSRDPGRITIRAQIDGGTLDLEVRDTGPGFPSGADRPGIGLANTRARLEQLFGEADLLECGNRPEGGATVRIRIPYRPQPAADRPRPC